MVIIYRYLPKQLVLIGLMLLACMVFSDQALAETRVFELQHRSAGELSEIVREFVGDSAKVAAHRNTLVVNASSAELAEIAKLVASYDRAQRMLRVTVDQGNRLNDQSRELNASGRLRSGSVAVDLNKLGRG
jgi:type II secretory pathway component GspD/PulD (secretin)